MQKKNFALVVAAAFMAAVVLSSCDADKSDDTAVSTGQLAFVVGSGQDGHDASIHALKWSGQTIDQHEGDLEAQFVPSGPRNFKINDGTQKDLNNKLIGDYHTPILAYTKEGTPVHVQLALYWQLNQNVNVLENEFYPFCFKYTCFSTQSTGGSANFSTKGWNGMLAENFPDAITSEMLDIMPQYKDDIWQNHDTKQWGELASQLSKGFSAAIAPTTGSQDDLFCGSGTSGWSDPAHPGAKGNTFECTPVRFVVKDVSAADPDLQQLANDKNKAIKQASVNQEILDAAKKRYGDNAGNWLGMLDAIKQCNASRVTCVVNVGGGASPSVNVP